MPGFQGGKTSRSWLFLAGSQTTTGPGSNDGCGVGNGAPHRAHASGLTQAVSLLA